MREDEELARRIQEQELGAKREQRSKPAQAARAAEPDAAQPAQPASKMQLDPETLAAAY